MTLYLLNNALQSDNSTTLNLPTKPLVTHHPNTCEGRSTPTKAQISPIFDQEEGMFPGLTSKSSCDGLSVALEAL